MNKEIVEILANEALKHIDMEDFAKKLAPKLMKEVEASIIREVKEVDWSDFVYDAVQTDELTRAIKKRVSEAFKNVA